MNKTVLIIDDDRSARRMISKILQQGIPLGFQEAENGKEALRILKNDRENTISLIILDLDMPVMGGLEALPVISEMRPDVPVIVLTGNDDAQVAVEAMKSGAVDFLSKPIETARLDVSARNALKMSLMSREISKLKRYTAGAFRFSDLIGCETGLRDHVGTGRKAAACDLPVLVSGETGTGKEIFARAIHGESARAGKSFVAVNCGAIPEKLVESTLFGHEKGAFTGAVNKAPGKFQEASGGTIFLDEVGELPLEAQVKLLRILQQGEVEPVGAGRPVRVDVRVVSATNRDLSAEVREGRFRKDLFFRLNVLHINLPPLRNRKADIPELAEYFIEQFCASHRVLPKRISEAAMKKLQNYAWPGNVRELENVVNRTMALSEDGDIHAGGVSFLHAVEEEKAADRGNVIVPVHPDGRFKTFRELEYEIVTLALAHHQGNMSQTARVLGIAKSTLYTKVEALADLKSA